MNDQRAPDRRFERATVARSALGQGDPGEVVGVLVVWSMVWASAGRAGPQRSSGTDGAGEWRPPWCPTSPPRSRRHRSSASSLRPSARRAGRLGAEPGGADTVRVSPYTGP